MYGSISYESKKFSSILKNEFSVFLELAEIFLRLVIIHKKL